MFVFSLIALASVLARQAATWPSLPLITSLTARPDISKEGEAADWNHLTDSYRCPDFGGRLIPTVACYSSHRLQWTLPYHRVDRCPADQCSEIDCYSHSVIAFSNRRMSLKDGGAGIQENPPFQDL